MVSFDKYLIDKTNWRIGAKQLLQDYFSPMLDYINSSQRIDAEEVTKLYYSCLVRNLGLPELEKYEIEPFDEDTFRYKEEVKEYFYNIVYEALFQGEIKLSNFYSPFTSVPEDFVNNFLHGENTDMNDFNINYKEARRVWAKFKPEGSVIKNAHEIQAGYDAVLKNGAKLVHNSDKTWTLRAYADKSLDAGEILSYLLHYPDKGEQANRPEPNERYH